jgi:hypothetical protein
MNSMATLRCHLNGALKSQPRNFNSEHLFRWPASSDQATKERQNRLKIIPEKDDFYRMEISNLTSDDLGIVICECLGKYWKI